MSITLFFFLKLVLQFASFVRSVSDFAHIVDRFNPIVQVAAEEISLGWALACFLCQKHVVLLELGNLYLNFCSANLPRLGSLGELHQSLLLLVVEVLQLAVLVELEASLLLHVVPVLLNEDSSQDSLRVWDVTELVIRQGAASAILAQALHFELF